MTPGNNEPIKLGPNPQTIALAFTSGVTLQRPGMDGRPRVMFSLADGRKLFCSDEEANEIEHEIEEQGIRKGDPIVLTRIGRGDSAVIRVQRAGPPAQLPTASAPASQGNSALVVGSVLPAAHAQMTTSEPAQGNTAAASRLTAIMYTVIDAMVQGKAYAQRRGIDLTNEDLRCLANAALIQDSKGGR